MTERYPPPGNEDGPNDDCPYSWISEWLCEYVDGTMDPSMRAVFDEYLEANPELAAHVERLCRTRTLLNECECQRDAVERTKKRLQKVSVHEAIRAAEAEGEADADASPAPESDLLSVPVRATTVAAVASAMTLMLGLGMVAGATFFADQTEASHPVATEQAHHAPDRPAVAPSSARGRAPLSSRARSAAPFWSSSYGSSAPFLETLQREGTPPIEAMRPGTADSVWNGSPGRPALLQAGMRP